MKLFDTCGVFKQIDLQCPTANIETDKSNTNLKIECNDIPLLPKEVKEISWTLIADEAKVNVPKPSCKLKVAVSYPFKTPSQSEVYFINSKEAKLQKEQGTFRERSSVPQKGEGPISVYVVPDNNVKQPILGNPSQQTDSYFPVSLYLENKGSGFLSKPIKWNELTIKTDQLTDNKECVWGATGGSWTPGGKATDELTLIGKKSPPYPCQLKIPKDGTQSGEVDRELTQRLEVDFKDPYTYEFRKESSLLIEPA